MAATRYLVAYDISHPDRLRRVARILEGAGDRQQYSVFLCDLSDRTLQELITRLTEVIHMTEDQVLIVDLGPASGRGRSVFQSVGRAFTPPERQPLVI